MPGGDNKHGVLDQHIDELEALLAERRRSMDPAVIPVLDELADGSAPAAETAHADPVALEPKQLVEIWHRLEHRIDAEMVDLAAALKSVVKRCIQEELRSCMPARRPATGAPESDSSDPASAEPKSGMH